MLSLHSFTFNPFQENTYILFNEEKEAIIIDPGCYNAQEEQVLLDFIAKNQLRPTQLINTHCHLDHIFGNAFVASTFKLQLFAHPLEADNINGATAGAMMFGLPPFPTIPIAHELNEGDIITLGDEELQILFVPGHSPGHLAFVYEKGKWVLGGDVLFSGSIGRTDLPGGSYAILEKSIREKMYALPEDYTVYAGHGPSTSIGHEKKHNAFVRA